MIQHVIEGKGGRPVASSKVKVHYHGKLVDGTVFDSSVARGEPIEFPLGGASPFVTSIDIQPARVSHCFICRVDLAKLSRSATRSAKNKCSFSLTRQTGVIPGWTEGLQL